MDFLTYAEHMDRAAKGYLEELLEHTNGNITHSARIAGVNRTHFYELMARHGFPRKPVKVGRF